MVIKVKKIEKTRSVTKNYKSKTPYSRARRNVRYIDRILSKERKNDSI